MIARSWRYGFLRIAFVLVVAGSTGGPVSGGTWDFDGQGELTREKIEAFLNRAVVHFDTVSFGGFSTAEWERTKQFLLDTQAKFIHGAELSWGRSYPDHSYWDQCAARFADLHATPGLQDVIVEGFIAEHIGSNADSTLIPEWLWNEMEAQGISATRTLSPNDRDGLHYFHYDNFFDSTWPHINRWGAGASVPDITRTETKLYFRYLLREYIDAGIESIWFGGIELVSFSDANNVALNELCQYARDYAAQHGRRHAILFTSHTAGRLHDGQELLDYLCYPTRMRYTDTYPSGLEINTALADTSVRDLIGIIENPSDLPVLLEIDNYACAPVPPISGGGTFDEITGFAYKEPEQRRAFLRQYYYEVRDWVNLWCNRRVYLAMPGRRNICVETCTAHANSNPAIPYPGNWYSPYREHCGDEDTIAGLFSGQLPPLVPSAASAPATEPAAPPGTPVNPWLDERFDNYADGEVAGQGSWTKAPDRGSAAVQSHFAPAGGGKALKFDPLVLGQSIENKLAFVPQTGGLRRLSFDVALVDSRPPGAQTEVTVLRMTLRNGRPAAEALPNSAPILFYWGSPSRIVYQGNQVAIFLASPENGRWYHVEMVLDLDLMEVDLILDGATVLTDLPLRDCESHSLGSLALTGFMLGLNVQSHLDNLIGADCDSLAPYAGEDCDQDHVPDQCEPNRDQDDAIDDCDNCPDLASPDQTDGDGDGVGDPCDNCPALMNPDQIDSEGDGAGDACDDDDDNDGVLDAADNCPLVANAAQQDRDADGLGDACDACPDTLAGVPVDASGCTPAVPGDYDRDGDVDQVDFGHLQRCLAGDGKPPPTGCADTDADGDTDVDRLDFDAFHDCFSGANSLADPACGA